MDKKFLNNTHASSKIKFLLTFLLFFVGLALVNHYFIHEIVEPGAIAAIEADMSAHVNPDEDILATDSVNDDSVFDIVRKNSIQGVTSFKLDFPDENDVQLEAAQRNGVKPLDSRDQIDDYVQMGELVYVGNSPYFHLDNLTHSVPYLTPRTFHLVNTICVNFIDSLISKGMQPHIPVITSVLRTIDDVDRLRRGNINSVERSAHCYGTTVDITYNRFMPIMYDGTLSTEPTRYNFQQKLVLAEVLRDLRLEGRCYVKYEFRQACFHLTIR